MTYASDGPRDGSYFLTVILGKQTYRSLLRLKLHKIKQAARNGIGGTRATGYDLPRGIHKTGLITNLHQTFTAAMAVFQLLQKIAKQLDDSYRILKPAKIIKFRSYKVYN